LLKLRVYFKDNTFSEVTDTVRSCSRHDLVAARLISESPGSLYVSFKNIYPFGITLKSSVTVHIFGMDKKKRWAVRTHCSPH